MMRFSWLGLLMALLSGCVDLDGFVHNPVHCSTVTEENCEGKDDVWDKICKSCEEPYDFADAYEFTDEWYARDIPSDSVTNHKLETADGEGEIDLYWVQGHGENNFSQTTLLYQHGNYAGIEHYLPNVRYFYEAGFNVVVWDYRGYGKSLPDTTPNASQWFFDTELLLIAQKNGYSIKEIPVRWIDDPDSRVKIISTAWEDIKGLLRLRFGGRPKVSGR